MADINEENRIIEITKKLEDKAEQQDVADNDKQWQGHCSGGSSCPPPSSRNKLLQAVDDEDEGDEGEENDINRNDNEDELSDIRARGMAEEMVLKFRRVAEDAYSAYENIRNTISAPIIIAMKGDLTTGRKLVAFYVASILRCPLIRESDFENYKEKSEENQAKFWRKICNLAGSQFKSGRFIVVDTELASQNEFDKLKELSGTTKTTLAVFECQMELACLERMIRKYESKNDPIIYILHKLMNKPTSEYMNSTNINTGEVPRILVEQDESLGFAWSAHSALVELWSHIFPNIESQKGNDCNHLFKFTNIEDDYKRPCCQCMQLVSGPVYRCQECRIIFHPACSYFPESLRFEKVFSWEYFTLVLKHVVPEVDADASCNCCKQLIRSSTSSQYYSTEDGDVLFDLECLFFLPSKLTTKIHEHELERAFNDNDNPLSCNQCGSLNDNMNIVYFCVRCGLQFDVYCISLPEMLQSNRDKHPLKLSIISRTDPYPYFCHGCEKERNTEKWIYYCEDCDFSVHPRCIIEAPCRPRYLSTEFSTTNKKSKEKLNDTEFRSCNTHLSIEKMMAIETKFKESAKEIKLPIIIITKGHSTGRKLVASTLAATFACLLIDEDIMCKVTHNPNEPKLVCYREFSHIALSQLQIGLSVVIDCYLSQESEFFILRDFALATQTPLFIVEFKPHDEDRMQDFHRIVPSDYEYDVGETPKISLNVHEPNFDDMDKLMSQILHSISAYIKESSEGHAKEPMIQSCYRHNIEFQKDYDIHEGDICNGCSKKLSYPILSCEDCDLVLHNACTQLPSRLLICGYLFDLENYGDDNDKVRCGCCNELVKDYAYILPGEPFVCVDLNCLLTPSKPGNSPHKHPLSLELCLDSFQCRGCGSNRSHILAYFCSDHSCDFQIGVKCGWLKDTVLFDRHQHPFHLIVSPEHVSDQYYCEVCQEERDKKDLVYCCIGCEYFIHVRCLMPATACCPPSES